jgi:hypothetical protein
VYPASTEIDLLLNNADDTESNVWEGGVVSWPITAVVKMFGKAEYLDPGGARSAGSETALAERAASGGEIGEEIC